MSDVTLEQLLEAGCHFGHKAERWNPRAEDFIYTKKDGIHIIDLAKTKAGLDQACDFIKETVSQGGEVLFVATKRQAKEIVKSQAAQVGAPYFSERWVGGFLTNWEEIKKNIDKANTMTKEKEEGVWKKYPKHEQMKLTRYLNRLILTYGGVTKVTRTPDAIFVIDVKKEISTVREAVRMNIPLIAIVDTNSDPTPISYIIPANDDAVGSISLIVSQIAQAYSLGKNAYEEALTKDKELKEKEQKNKDNQPKLTKTNDKSVNQPKTGITEKESVIKPKTSEKSGKLTQDKTVKTGKVTKESQAVKPVKKADKPEQSAK